ncbi:MAG: hypothetical protein WBD74_09300 [Candidatus Aquilonibacter sp.]
MRILQSFVILALLSAALPASASTMSHIAFLEGTWSCTISSPGGKQTEIDHNSATLGRKWMHFAGSVAAGMGRPARTYDGYLGPDPNTHGWVYDFVDSFGDYGIFKSSEAPDAKTQTWIGLDAMDPNDRFTFHALSTTKYTIDFVLVVNGHAAHTHQACTKT